LHTGIFGVQNSLPFPKEAVTQSLSIEMSQNAFLRDACPITFTTTSSKMPFMSTIRTPLGPINRNITWGKELTPKLRNKICVLAENGHDIPFIIRRYKVSQGVVRYTLDHQASRPETNISASRPGAKKNIQSLRQAKPIVLCVLEPKTNIYPAEKGRGGVLYPQNNTLYPLRQ
jgi:hypothetical protein